MAQSVFPERYEAPFCPTTFIGEVWEAEAATHYFRTEEEMQLALGVAYYAQQDWNRGDEAWTRTSPTHWQDATEILVAAGASVLLLLLL